MSKKNRKDQRLAVDYSSDLTQDDQLEQLAKLMNIARAVQSGNIPDTDIPVPNVEGDDHSLDAVTDAISEGFRAFDAASSGGRVHMPPTINHITPVSVRDIGSDTTGDPDGYVPPAKMQPPKVEARTDSSTSPAENRAPAVTEIPADPAVSEEDSAEEDQYNLSDFPILFINGEDAIITVHNPRTSDEGVSMQLFGLREYDVEKDGNYEILKHETQWMLAMLAGPLMIAREDSPAFKKLIRLIVEEGRFDKDKFRIFAEKCDIELEPEGSGTKEALVYVVYSFDNISRVNLREDLLPGMEKSNTAVDFMYKVASLATNGFINPMAIEAEEWVRDFLSDSLTDEETIEVACDVIARENGYLGGDSPINMDTALTTFRQEFAGSVIAYVKSIRKVSELLGEKMTPEAYRESFMESGNSEDAASAADVNEYNDSEEIEEAVTEVQVQTPGEAVATVAASPEANVSISVDSSEPRTNRSSNFTITTQ